MDKIEFNIIGQGALGTGVYQILKDSGITAKLIGRHDRIAQSINSVVNIYAVKAYDLFSAISHNLILENLHQTHITISNGAIDHILKHFAHHYPQHEWCLGVTDIGARWDIFHKKVILTNENGKIYLNKKINLEIFSINKDIKNIYRQKWLFNTVANSLCGVHRLPRNGLLLEMENFLHMREIFHEAFLLAEEIWYFSWKESEDILYKKFLDLMKKTSGNENSMAVDVRLRRKTETDFFAGLSIGCNGYERLKKLHSFLNL